MFVWILCDYFLILFFCGGGGGRELHLKLFLSYGLAFTVLDCTVSDDAGAAAEYCMRYQLQLSVTIVTTTMFDVRYYGSRVLNWCKLG